VDRTRYLTKPASREDLRVPVRNFFVRLKDGKVLSMADPLAAGVASLEQMAVEIGQLWHRVTRLDPALGLEMTALSFIPVSGEKIELTRFTVRNTGTAPAAFTPTAVIPVFGRALANKHDHEHVTSLLNRITQVPEGVIVEPTMRFNEEGHKTSSDVYAVLGISGDGALPSGSFPTMENFAGAGGDLARPEAVVRDLLPRDLSSAERDGHEAVGALRFSGVTLAPGASVSYIIGIGIETSPQACLDVFARFKTPARFDQALAANDAFWKARTSTIVVDSGDARFSAWMRWVTLQPVLRRIFGCSFLPDHDYGKGGKGWRDIWQDLLSLILIEPEGVRGDLLNNFAGVRIDGSNATIIGQKPGEFIADRNAITRVWMDHGAWPFLTAALYADQTGDDGFFFEKAAYFADPQMSRTFERDTDWVSSQGHQLLDRQGNVYQGTVLEHILVQNLVQFFNVGEHNITRLESADWNDGLDMAFRRGESVAFMAFYGGNLIAVADLLERLRRDRGLTGVQVAKELLWLLDTLSVPGVPGAPVDYSDAAAKRTRLFEVYFPAVQPRISGETVLLDTLKLACDLRIKGEWVLGHIRGCEKVNAVVNGRELTWFNGYYDNDGQRVEGLRDGRVHMTLTGQVFALMNGVVRRDEARDVAAAVKACLRDEHLGGYRLNTDFGVRHYLSLGRAFGFAFGAKENGAVFSHMCVMYAYALYTQGLAREGHEVLRSLYEMSISPGRARIYPGIPEYFDASGRGMYHFLTGSASWYVLTLLTQVYGVRGRAGDLELVPRLVSEEFGQDLTAKVGFHFAGRRFTVVYDNPGRLEAGAYRVKTVAHGGHALECMPAADGGVRIARAVLGTLPDGAQIRVLLAGI
jgi:hypothetical protein